MWKVAVRTCHKPRGCSNSVAPIGIQRESCECLAPSTAQEVQRLRILPEPWGKVGHD